MPEQSWPEKIHYKTKLTLTLDYNRKPLGIRCIILAALDVGLHPRGRHQLDQPRRGKSTMPPSRPRPTTAIFSKAMKRFERAIAQHQQEEAAFDVLIGSRSCLSVTVPRVFSRACVAPRYGAE